LERPDSILLNLSEHGICAGLASGIACPEGRVVVEMLPIPEAFEGLFLPQSVAANMRPDVGIVLCAGPDVDLAPGCLVAVRGYDGQWIRGFDFGGYETKNEIRVYGHYVDHRGNVKATLWHDSIPVLILQETEDMVALNHNLIVRRETPVTHLGPLELRESSHYRTGIAEVLSIGPKCDLAIHGGEVQVGDLIQYDVYGELAFEFGGDHELAIIPDVAVNMVVTPL
jgi:hypothetical protein